MAEPMAVATEFPPAEQTILYPALAGSEKRAVTAARQKSALIDGFNDNYHFVTWGRTDIPAGGIGRVPDVTASPAVTSLIRRGTAIYA